MVQVDQGKLQPFLEGNSFEQMKQPHRISSARDGDSDAVSGAEEFLLLQTGPEFSPHLVTHLALSILTRVEVHSNSPGSVAR